MEDEADIRLINTHAEGNRRDDNPSIAVDKSILMLLAGFTTQVCVIRECLNPIGAEIVAQGLDLVLRLAVNNARFAVVGIEKRKRLPKQLYLRFHSDEEIRPVETCNELVLRLQLQRLRNVRLHPRRGGGCHRYADSVRKPFAHRNECPILRTEIVAPLRDTVRLVNCDARDIGCVKHQQDFIAHEGFRCDVKQLNLAAFHLMHRVNVSVIPHSAVEKSGRDTSLLQLHHLVLHE